MNHNKFLLTICVVLCSILVGLISHHIITWGDLEIEMSSVLYDKTGLLIDIEPSLDEDTEFARIEMILNREYGKTHCE